MAITTMLFYVIARRRWRLVAAARRRAWRRRFSRSSWRSSAPISRRSSHGGWVPLVIAAGDLPRHDDVAARHAAPHAPAHRPLDAAREVLRRRSRRSGRRASRAPPSSSPRTRRHAGGARAPPPAQQGAARARHLPVGGGRGHPGGAGATPTGSEGGARCRSASPRVIARYGFMETPNVAGRGSRAAVATGSQRWPATTSRTTSAGRRCIPIGRRAMVKWRKLLFAFLATKNVAVLATVQPDGRPAIAMAMWSCTIRRR